MKRTVTLILATLCAAVLFWEGVHAVLVAADVSEPAGATVYGMTPRRIWAAAAAGLALAGAVTGGLALRRSTRPVANRHGRSWAPVAVAAGLIAAINGGLNLAVATGGPGTGNGVIGGAAALVLGLIGLGLGGLALRLSRPAA